MDEGWKKSKWMKDKRRVNGWRMSIWMKDEGWVWRERRGRIKPTLAHPCRALLCCASSQGHLEFSRSVASVRSNLFRAFPLRVHLTYSHKHIKRSEFIFPSSFFVNIGREGDGNGEVLQSISFIKSKEIF